MAIQSITPSTAAPVTSTALLVDRSPRRTGAVQQDSAVSDANAVSALNQTAQAQDAPAVQATREEVETALNDIRKVVEPVARNLQFSIDEETGKTIVKVVDRATDEVIKQFPSEEILAIARALDKLSGLFIKQKA